MKALAIILEKGSHYNVVLLEKTIHQADFGTAYKIMEYIKEEPEYLTFDPSLKRTTGWKSIKWLENIKFFPL